MIRSKIYQTLRKIAKIPYVPTRAVVFYLLRNRYDWYDRNTYKTPRDPIYWYYYARQERELEIGDLSIDIDISGIGAYNETEFVLDNEVIIIEDILTELSEDDVFLDVGANIGIHSLFAKQIAETVIGIEPHPANLAIFTVNNTKNQSEVDVYSCAFTKEVGYFLISGPRAGVNVDGKASVSKDADYSLETNNVAVKGEIGDRFIQENDIPHPTVIKIDVEGAEEDVIDGLTDMLRDCRSKRVYVEIHLGRGSNYDDITAKFKSAGYNVTTIQSRTVDTVVKAHREN
jgi:FkbM family methyltransferase